MIEFRCRACRRLLQVADDLVGRDARCPACSAVNQVPPLAEVSRSQAGNVAGEPAEENFAATLPYQHTAAYGSAAAPWRQPLSEGSPQFTNTGSAATPSAAPARTIKPTLINVGDILSQSWRIYVANLGSVIGAALIVYLLNSICGLLVNTLHNSAASSANDVADVLIWLITFVAGTAFTVWLTAGLMLYMLRIARGEPTHFGQLFEAGPLVISASIASVIYLVIVSIGLVACIVPGIILGLMYWMSLSLVVDARMGVAEAFRTSQQVTMNNKLSLAGIWAISIGAAATGFLACGIGLVFAVPFVAVLQTVTYLAMTGQPITVAPVVPVRA